MHSPAEREIIRYRGREEEIPKRYAGMEEEMANYNHEEYLIIETREIIRCQKFLAALPFCHHLIFDTVGIMKGSINEVCVEMKQLRLSSE